MRRFLVTPLAPPGARLHLPEEVQQHLRVLRLQEGSNILLFDGSGNLADCRLLVEGRQLSALVEDLRQEARPVLDLQIIQGLPKGSKFELVLQKGTELGATRITPVFCQNGDVTLPRDRREARTLRWRKISQEAARQCGASWLPTIDEPQQLESALSRCTAELRLMPWERESRPLQTCLTGQQPQSVAILVGPEGGFADQEVAMAARYGFVPTTLGPRILRSETAGIAVAAVLQYLFGDFGTAPGGHPEPPPDLEPKAERGPAKPQR